MNEHVEPPPSSGESDKPEWRIQYEGKKVRYAADRARAAAATEERRAQERAAKAALSDPDAPPRNKGGRPRADGKPNKNGVAPPKTDAPKKAEPAAGAASIVMGAKYIQALYQPARHKAFFGGRGAAKSWSIATYLVVEAAKRKMKIVCARQFQNSIRDSSKELIEKRIEALGLSSQYAMIERSIIHIGTGSVFLFVGLERNIESIRSLEGADVVWVEEARTINQKSLDVLLPTVRAPNSELIWSWNPEKRTDPVDKYFRGPNPPDRSVITHVSWEDNPYFFATEMPAEMELLRKGNPRRFGHVWEGEYDESYDTKVFTNIVIGRVEVPIDCPPRYGMDFGFGQDPSVVVKVYVLEKTRQIYIAQEIFGRVPMENLPDMVRSVVFADGDLVMADSSQPGTIEFLQSRGLNVRPARKGQGSVKTGILWMQGYEIVIDPDCGNMREEARLYSWITDKLTGMSLSIPVDANNHGWDATRYATESCQMDGDSGDGGVFRFRLWK
jgi:phage terminase large subunit